MTDKAEAIRRVEEVLGSEGSTEEAVRVFRVLEERGLITFDAVSGYLFDSIGLDAADWLDILSAADAMEVN